jgi:MFS family permease
MKNPLHRLLQRPYQMTPEPGHIPSHGSGEAATPEELAAQLDADKAVAGALKNVRSAAQKWQAVVGTILGLFAISGFIKGPADFLAVDPAWRWSIPWLLAIAVAAGLVATLLAAWAAIGLPHWRWIAGETLAESRHKAMRTATDSLIGAIVMAVVAYLLFAIAVGLLWFAPRAGNASVTLITTRTRVVCGQISSLTQKGVTIADQLSGADVTVRLADIQVVQTTSICPTVSH